MFREDLQNAIKDTIIKYKEIISRNDTGVCAECFNELKQEQVIDEIKHNLKLINNNKRASLG